MAIALREDAETMTVSLAELQPHLDLACQFLAEDFGPQLTAAGYHHVAVSLAEHRTHKRMFWLCMPLPEGPILAALALTKEGRALVPTDDFTWMDRQPWRIVISQAIMLTGSRVQVGGG